MAHRCRKVGGDHHIRLSTWLYSLVSAHFLGGRCDKQKNIIPHAVLTPLKTFVLRSVSVSVEIVDGYRGSFVDFVY
jgi:hypothetical protein